MNVATLRLTLLVFLLGTLPAGAARGQGRDKTLDPLPRQLSVAALTQDGQPPPYTPPGALVVDPALERRDRPVTEKWWFWAAVGGVIVATVVVILVAGGEPDPPKTVLGNMDGFQGVR